MVVATLVLNLPSLYGDLYLDGTIEEEGWGTFGLYLLAVSAVYPLQLSLFYSAASFAARGLAPSLSQLAASALTSFPRVFVTSWVAGLAIVLGFVLLFLPGIYLSVRYAFADVVAFNSQPGPIESCRRSSLFTRGRFWQIFLLGVAFYGPVTIAYGLYGALSSSFPVLESAAVAGVLSCAVAVLTALYPPTLWFLHHNCQEASVDASPRAA